MSTSKATKRLACLQLDQQRLADTNATVSDLAFSNAYADFAYGKWETCVLRNPTGHASQAIIRESTRTARTTEIGRKLPYLEELIDRVFAVDRLRWARLMRVADNGCVIPHRDFLEFGQPFTRLHVCLKTNPGAWNSEDRRLYHMRVGEVWYLDATRVHSAACFSSDPRVHLVLDFAGNDDPVRYIAHAPATPPDQPADAARTPMPAQVSSAITSLGDVLNEANFRDIVAILAKLHFRYDVDAADMFDWLRAAGRRSGNRRLDQMAADLERTCILSRPLLPPAGDGTGQAGNSHAASGTPPGHRAGQARTPAGSPRS